jgi:hypothetical protein
LDNLSRFQRSDGGKTMKILRHIQLKNGDYVEVWFHKGELGGGVVSCFNRSAEDRRRLREKNLEEWEQHQIQFKEGLSG